MPLYDYQCKKCTNIFEFEHAIGEEPKVKCPDCDGASKKLISRVGVVFKGSGFYATDNRKSSGGNGSTAKDEPSKAPKGKSEEQSGKKAVKKSQDDTK